MDSRTHPRLGPITQAPSVCAASLGEQLHLFDLRDRRLHVLNPSAATIWSAATEPMDMDSLVSAVAAHYAVSVDEIRDDVVAVVEQLTNTGLLVEHSGIASGANGPLVIPARATTGATSSGRPNINLGPFVGLGVQMNVRCCDAQVAARLDAVLDPLRSGRRVASGVVELMIDFDNGMWSVWSDGALLIRTVARDVAVRTLLSECNAAPLRYLDDHVVFHASAADFGSGLVMLAGVSNSGKSTLVTQLVERGYGYVSDEAIAVSARSGRALPFPKSICLEPGAQRLLPHLDPGRQSAPSAVWDVDPRTVGPGVLSPGGPLAAIVFPTFDATATSCELAPVSPHDVVPMLLANAFNFDLVGQAAFQRIVSLAAEVPAYTLVHHGGDAPLVALEHLVTNLPLSL